MAEGPVASLLSAVVIGGTGAIGNCLVGALLKSKVIICAIRTCFAAVTLLVFMQESVGEIALLTRRKVTEVPAQYGVDVAAEEASGRLVQHVEGYLQSLAHYRRIFPVDSAIDSRVEGQGLETH